MTGVDLIGASIYQTLLQNRMCELPEEKEEVKKLQVTSKPKQNIQTQEKEAIRLGSPLSTNHQYA